MKNNSIFRKTALALLAVVTVVCFSFASFLYGANALSSSDWTGVDSEWAFETDGASPLTENAVMQYKTKLSGNFKVEFDLVLSSAYTPTTDFQVALFAKQGDGDMAYAYTVAISGVNDNVSVINNTVNSAAIMNMVDMGKTLRDDTARTLSVISYEGKLYLIFDGLSIVSGNTLTVTEGYLNVSAPSILDKISGFEYYPNYTPTAEETENNNLLDVSYNFENDVDAAAFTASWDGWVIDSGVYRPKNQNRTVYLTEQLLLNKQNIKTTVSIDFSADSSNTEAALLNIGFVSDVSVASSIGKGLAVHFAADRTVVNDWVANNNKNGTSNTCLNTTSKIYTNNGTHNVTFVFKNGYADVFVDGEVLYEGWFLEEPIAYLWLQGRNKAITYVDNVTIKEQAFMLDASFSSISEQDLFASKYLGWKVYDGKYYANGAWATTYYDSALDLSKPLEINFDFCLTAPTTSYFDNTMQFNIGLVDFNGNAVNQGFSVHFFNHSSHKIYMSTLNWDFGNPANGNQGVWIADDTQNCFDGQLHHFTIKFKKGYAYFELDGRSVYTAIEVRTNPAYLIFQTTDTSYYIDNLSIVEGVDYSKDLDFSYSTDNAEFVDGYRGFSVNQTTGTFHPNITWGSTCLKDYIDLSGKNYISMDFKTSSSLKIGFVEYAISTGTGAGLCMISSGSDLTLRQGSTGNDKVLDSQANNYRDGLVHNLVITIVNGIASFEVDGVQIFSSQPIGTDTTKLFIQIENRADYIDNLKVAKTIKVTDTVLEQVDTEEKQVFLGYYIEGGRYQTGLYKAGETIEVIDGMTVKPVVADFYMHYGVQVRLKEGGGLRWQTIMDKEGYNAILESATTVQFGTLITSEGSDKFVDIPLVNGGYLDGDNFVWNSALTDIKQANYERLIKGTGYMTVTYADGTTQTFYAVNDQNEKSYFTAIQTLYNKVSDTQDEVFTTEVVDLDGKTVYATTTLSVYNYIKAEYSKMKNYLGK